MKTLVVLLFFVFALANGFPSEKWEKRRQGARKPNKNWEFEDWKVKLRPGDKKAWKRPGDGMGPHGGEYGQKNDVPQVRWCVTNPCEMKKCKRMTTEFNYMVNPRLHWSCVMASCKKSCVEEIRLGNADIMTAEGEDIYMAGKMYDLKPVMSTMEDHQDILDYDTKFAKYEEADGSLKHYAIALVKKTNPDVNSYQDMDQRKSCHSGMDAEASFKSPVCSLIEKSVIPRAGNVFESAGEFFKESCVPGVQHEKYNPNMTNPESLCKLCKGPEDDDFCETLSDKEPYYGFTGTLKCLRDGAGDVAFVHTHDVMKNYNTLYNEFDIVCKNKRLSLDWDNVIKTDCHLTEEHPQVLMVSSDKPKDWVKVCTSALKDASTRFSTPGSVNAFSMFDSTPYCAKSNDGDSQDQKDDKYYVDYKWDKNWMKNKDLIFKDYTGSLVVIPEDKRTYKKFLGEETAAIWKTCAELEPKPRAFICVVGDEELKKCKDMISKFQTITDVKKISWGCIEAMSKKECVEMVAKNVADIADLNATEMFMAGMDYNLAPFIAENYKKKDPMTESITIGVMLKDNTDLPEDMRGWKMCNAGVHKISGFLHPMGWLLANDTIKRSSSPLRSIGHYFGESCVPGMNTLDLTKHPLLSRTVDWRSMIKGKVVRWEDWYRNPLWRKWQDKQNGNSDEYHPMHDMQSFDSPEFVIFLETLTSEHPRMHAFHTPEIHEAMEKLKKDFSWDNYEGFEDFYHMPVPKWKMVSWVWQKPEDWTEQEWALFNMWAEQQWDQKEDWASYTDKWTVADWEMFKNWMDTEYKDYTTDHMPLHKDAFIRLSLLCSRHHWLIEQWTNLQWDNMDMKHCRERMCEACAGQGNDKCSMDPISEVYYDYEGALKCLKGEDGDVAFMDAYTLDDAISNNGYTKGDFVLLCPDGTTVDYTGIDSIKKCNFGRVPSHALVTCNMHDGVWRWKVTKAFLEAQKFLAPQMFQDGIFNKDVESLKAIPFVNQTYQVYLGPKFLLAMEGLMQPPVKDWEEEFNPMEECEGEQCDEDVQDRPPCDECAEDDVMCMENCWSVEPSENKPLTDKNGPRPHRRHKSRRTGGKRRMGRYGNRRQGGVHGKSHKKATKTMKEMKKNMLWKPKGRKMHPIMEKKHMEFMKSGMMNMGPMKQQGMKPMGPSPYGINPMRSPKMGHQSHMGPMIHGMKPMSGMMHPGKVMGQMMYSMKPMPGMMHPDKMGPMVHGMKPKTYGMQMMTMERGMMMGQGHRMMHHRMETGPIIHSRKSVRGEFYTKVVFVREGTCNTITHDLRCFGEQKNIRMRAGRVGKTLISVPMCPKPTIMKNTTAQFTCDTGATFMEPVLLPVKCAYVPCNPGFWLPDWSKDQYWDKNRVEKTKPWGKGKQ